MKNKKSKVQQIGISLLILILTAITACSGGGGKKLNSTEELKAYLDSKPANSKDKPIKVAMKLDGSMLEKVRGIINDSGKYVSLDISGSTSTTIPRGAFFDTDKGEGCKLLVEITISDNVTSIGEWTFSECAGLAKVTIGNSVTSIGQSAFNGCTSLTSITMGSGVTNIERDVFSGCTSLTSLTIGSGVTNIERDVFSDCTSLTSITIPDSVTSIGWRAFSGCTSLTSITIPNSVTSIGESFSPNIFQDCTSLTKITVDVGNTAYSSQDGVLYNKAKTHLVAYPGGKKGAFTVPDGVTNIDESAFYGCTNLTDVTISDSVTIIGEHAFYKCTGLTNVTIGNGVSRIGNYAFYGCTSLASVTIGNSVWDISEGAFDTCDNITSVTIKGGKVLLEEASFPSNNSLYTAYSKGKAGTYTREPNGNTWTKQSSGAISGTTSGANNAANVYYAATNLRLRSEPDTSKDNRIAGVSQGNRVELLETGKSETIDGITAPWFKVKTVDGTEGWLFSGYLTKTAPAN